MGKREYGAALQALVALALGEDVASGDVTGEALLDAEEGAVGVIRAQEPGVLSGLDAARATFLAVDARLRFDAVRGDGAALAAGDVVARICGSARAIMAAERVALNFLGHLAGIATLTARFLERVQGTGVRILDTRKTTPGMRLLEKLAVNHGGGVNHRLGLYDAIMIKDNHVAAVGDLAEALRRAHHAAHARPSGAGALPIIVETRTLAEVRIAVREGADRILLDNFAPEEIPAAVTIRDAAPPPRIALEVSGGITLENVSAHALPGVDFISVGALTHSAPALNLSLDLTAGDAEQGEAR